MSGHNDSNLSEGNWIFKLTQTLESMLAHHKSLLALCREQKQALIDGDIAKIEHITQRVYQTVERIRSLEAFRLGIVQPLAEDAGLKLDEIDATFVEQHVDTLYAKEKFHHVRHELIQVMNELQTQNDVIQQLTRQSIDYSNRVLGILSSAVSTSGYGQTASRHMGGRLINLQT